MMFHFDKEICIVNYDVFDNSGYIIVYCNSNDNEKHILSIAERELERKFRGMRIYGNHSLKILNRVKRDQYYIRSHSIITR